MTSSMDATEGRRLGDSFWKRKIKEHAGVEYLVVFREAEWQLFIDISREAILNGFRPGVGTLVQAESDLAW